MNEFKCPNCGIRAVAKTAPTNHRCGGKGAVRQMHQVVVQVRIVIETRVTRATRRG